jgi:hypothetical protein
VTEVVLHRFVFLDARDEVAGVADDHVGIERRRVDARDDLVDLRAKAARRLDAARLDRRTNEDREEPALFADVVAAARCSAALLELLLGLAEALAKRVGGDGWRRIEELEVAARALLDLVVVSLAKLVVDLSNVVERSVEKLVVLEEGVALAVAGVDRADPARAERLDFRDERGGEVLEPLGVGTGDFGDQRERGCGGEFLAHPSHFHHTRFVIGQ